MNNTIEDFLTITSNGLDVDANNVDANCITSKNNTFSMDTNGNLICNSITTNIPSSSTIIDIVYPIGAIYMSVNNTNPGSLFGGTWEQIKDRFLLSAGDIYVSGATGGESTHTLTGNELPAHAHSSSGTSTNEPGLYPNWGSKTGWGLTAQYLSGNGGIWYTGATGGGQPHNNMPPYLVVYVWKRIS